MNQLEPVKLTVWKVMIERVTVVKFRVNYRGGMVLAVLKSRYGLVQVMIERERELQQSCILESCCLSPMTSLKTSLRNSG